MPRQLRRTVTRGPEAARQEAQQRVAEACAELEEPERRERDAAHHRERIKAQVEDLAETTVVLTELRRDLDLAAAEAAGAHTAAVRGVREQYEPVRRAAEQEGER